jgi:hypothetical protein
MLSMEVEELRDRLILLGDQVQDLLSDVGFDVLGFTILVQHGTALTGESRSRITQPEYDRALIAYATH